MDVHCTPQEAALHYIEAHGWAVGRVWGQRADGSCACGNPTCHAPRKHPTSGHYTTTRDRDTAISWWGEGDYGVFANLDDSGLLEVDLDRRADGDFEEGLAALEDELGPLPDTATIKTPSGGVKMLFRAPRDARDLRGRSELRPHVELRVLGAVNLPPSPYAAGGHYAWAESKSPDEIALAGLPAPWIEAGRRAPKEEDRHGDGRADQLPEVVGEGARRTTLLSLAGTLRARGMGEAAILNQLASFNDAACEPPLEDSEVEALARDVAKRYPAGKPIPVMTPTPNGAGRSHSPDNGATVQQSLADRPDLALARDILGEVEKALHRCGVVGGVRVLLLLYLAITSRLLARPVNIAVKGASSTGKSFSVDKTVALFPDEATYAMTGMSERALVYSEEPLSHRTLVIYELVGMEGDWRSYLLRSLLSEGRIRYETVEKVKGGELKARLIEREGPTGLIVTTTATTLHPENETRLLSITVTDSREQTANVMRALAEQDGHHGQVDLKPWHDLQRWLAAGPREVVIPYAPTLANLITPVAVRLRRDFSAILGLIRAHALLHRATRDIDENGCIVATLTDYARVRDLVADIVAEGLSSTVPAAVRETVEVAKKLQASSDEGVNLRRLAGALKLDKSSVSRRARQAAQDGYLVNLEERRGKPARYVVADPMPEDEPILPTPESLVQHRNARPRPGGPR